MQSSKSQENSSHFSQTIRAKMPNGGINSLSDSCASNSRQDHMVADNSFKPPDKTNKTDDLALTTQTRNINGSVDNDYRQKKPAAALSAKRPLIFPAQTLKETFGLLDILRDRNINKQQISMSEITHGIFLHQIETAAEMNNSQHLLHANPALKATEYKVAQKQQNFENVYVSSPLSLGRKSEDYLIHQQSVQKEQPFEKQKKSPIKLSVDGDNYKEKLRNPVSSQYNTFDSITVPTQTFSDLESAKSELTSSLVERCNRIVLSESDRVCLTSAGFQEDNTSDKVSIEAVSSRLDTPSENCDCFAPIKSIRTEKRNTVTQNPIPSMNKDSTITENPIPSMNKDSNYSECVTVPNEYDAEDESLDLLYDDSVFPTKHNLGTSEAMRAAMMQARSHNNYRRSSSAGLNGRTKYGFQSNDGFFRRFPHTTRGDLLLKYRKIVSTVNRQSFNHWKADVSARAGQRREFNEDPELVAYQSFEKSLPSHNPHRLQVNMSNIYGKPSMFQTLPIDPVLKRKPKVSSIIKGSPSTSNCNTSDQLFNKNMAGYVINRSGPARFGGAYLNPTIRLEREGPAERNLVKAGLLSGLVSKSPGQPSKVKTTIKVCSLATDSSNNISTHKDATAQKETAGSLPKAPSSITTSSRRMASTLEDVIVLEPPKNDNWALRKWEIQNLEASLKNCGKFTVTPQTPD